MTQEQERAHSLIDRIPADQLGVALRFLEFLLLSPSDRAMALAPYEDEEISEEETHAVVRSKEWLRHNAGIPFEDVVADLGFTMDDIRNNATVADEEKPAA